MFQECFGCFCFRMVSGVNDERFPVVCRYNMARSNFCNVQNPYDIPWNPGWSIGILITAHYNPHMGCIFPSIQEITMKSWLVNRDSCHGLLQSLYYWVVFIIPYIQGFGPSQSRWYERYTKPRNPRPKGHVFSSTFCDVCWDHLIFFTDFLWDIFIYISYITHWLNHSILHLNCNGTFQ